VKKVEVDKELRAKRSFDGGGGGGGSRRKGVSYTFEKRGHTMRTRGEAASRRKNWDRYVFLEVPIEKRRRVFSAKEGEGDMKGSILGRKRKKKGLTGDFKKTSCPFSARGGEKEKNQARRKERQAEQASEIPWGKGGRGQENRGERSPLLLEPKEKTSDSLEERTRKGETGSRAPVPARKRK